MEKYAYVRVSIREQNEARQLAALEEYHIPQSNLFIENRAEKTLIGPNGNV